jgi:hypothetical protein
LTGSFAQVSGRSYFLDFSCHSLRKMRFLSMAMTDKYTAKAVIRRSNIWKKFLPYATIEIENFDRLLSS